ncbi:MAG: hypothetical protein ACE5GQ_00555 [Nitrospinales bacterium]
MNAIKLLLAILFVFLLCNTAFAKTGGIESGIASDSVSLQTGSDDPVNYAKGKGKNGDGGGGGGNSGSGQSGNGRGDRADGCEDGVVGPGDIPCVD